MARVVLEKKGSDAVKAFEVIHPTLAKTLFSNPAIDPNKVTLKRFDEGSLMWIIDLDSEEKAKAVMEWLRESVENLYELFGFSRYERTKIGGRDVEMVYMQSGRDEYPAAFWYKDNKLYWLESGPIIEEFNRILAEELEEEE
ncbi:hypothetical protein EYM_05420 [Ignicoccus islandicus DSM 13165]|uniref:Uncharacterized protein n=1 Tax=Ignicoccus islandicus DSM 13165 TaxID=940295 RepID=A0A0U3FRU1_9CREN|nr:hypothetical protein [Ignicoccus islandicus]ALU12583.1 hypothetical protein EYM_05420 [Ignicoccus islandicus DSM 13165]